MAAIASTTVECPGCHEHIDLTLRLDHSADARPGELVLAAVHVHADRTSS
ncbi:hypothetical protein AB0F46_21605 [Streptomyces sp. NPDC026665]